MKRLVFILFILFYINFLGCLLAQNNDDYQDLTLAFRYFQEENYQDALPIFDKYREDIMAAWEIKDIIGFLNFYAFTNRQVGNIEDSDFYFKLAYELQEALIMENPKEWASLSLCNILANWYFKHNLYAESTEVLEKCKGLQIKAELTQHNDYVVINRNLGYAYFELENYQQSVSNYEKARDLQKKLSGINTVTYINISKSLALSYSMLEQYNKSIAIYKEVEQLTNTFYGSISNEHLKAILDLIMDHTTRQKLI